VEQNVLVYDGDRLLRDAVAACAQGYPFPTNLDHDQPSVGRPDDQPQPEAA
jgi:hypothetical protein